MVISLESSVVEWRFAALTVISSCRRSGCAGSRDAEPNIVEVQFLIQKGSAIISSLRMIPNVKIKINPASHSAVASKRPGPDLPSSTL
jgi:hypothetical protein